eukprot:1158671-Pelagomonas_calceolata.AAC.5
MQRHKTHVSFPPPVCPSSFASLFPDSRSHTIAALSSPHVMANLPLESTRTLFSRPARFGRNIYTHTLSSGQAGQPIQPMWQHVAVYF